MRRPWTRALVLTAVALLSLGLAACSGSGSSSHHDQAYIAPPDLDGNVVDAEGYALENPEPEEDGGDDLTIYVFGHEAGPAEKRAITEVVNRYYTAAAAADGASGCALTLPSLAQALPEIYGRSTGPSSYLRGGTCAAVMTKLFKHFHHELVGPTVVMGVRVKRNNAIVLLKSRTLKYVSTRLTRQSGVWRFTKLIGAPLP